VTWKHGIQTDDSQEEVQQDGVSVDLGETAQEEHFPAGDRVAAKSAVKRCLYRTLSEVTGKTLPWGTLTGIRPTKIPMAGLEAGQDEETIYQSLRTEHLISEKKAALALDIAKRERALLSRIDYEKGYSLYIGIPFCPSTCLYCSFTSYPISMHRGRVDAYLDCLEQEIAFTAEHFKDRHLNTVYIGGGTPTTLEAGQLDRLCRMVESSFDLSHLLEFTVEAGRPDSVTEEKLAALRGHRVDRISVNPQTMKNETLKIIGRHHTVEQVIETYELARKQGFDNINMDLILGLPDETYSDVEHTMEEILKLSPDNLTVHSLALKRTARLNLERERYGGYSYENSEELMDMTHIYTKRMGMEPYYLYRQKNMAGNLENVGFAKEGKAGLYNILIMEEKQSIVACGAGATSKAVFPDGRIERCENVKDIASYLERINEMIDRKRKLF
jgi:oxygen-independent coproporphyrinogen-3 oxidase